MTKRFGPACGMAAMIAAGCSNDPGGTVEDRRVDLPPAPENGIQFVLPEATLQPGEEKLYCWYVTLPSDEDVWVQEYQAFQGEGGHHVVGFIALVGEPDGTVVDCEAPSSMMFWLPLLTPTADNHFVLPDGYGVRIEARAKLVFQSHYVNASDHPIKVADVVNLYFADPEDVAGITPAAPWGNTVLDFEVAPGETKTVTYECPAEQDMNLISLYGHMHQHGKSVSIQVGTPGDMETVYEVMEWKAEYRDRAPLREWTVEDPYVVQAGEVMRVSCTWTNDSPDPLTFPAEMCAALSWFYPGDSPLTCAGSPL